MIRVFVYEYTCAVAAADAAASLNAEGAAMLAALLEDFNRVPGVQAFTIRHEPDEPSAFRSAVGRADWSLIIAPEFDDILRIRCRWALEAGGRLLGPQPEAVALCADKLALAQHWHRCGVRTPVTVAVGEAVPWSAWVVKPRFGAGSLDTRLNGDLTARSDLGPLIVQEHVAGVAASVAFLIGPRGRIALPPARQHLSSDGQFEYRGGSIPLPPPLAERAIAIAAHALREVPGLNGYVGVDVVLGDDGRDWAMEINPRLTTSYVGLRALAKTNLAAAMLDLAGGRDPLPLVWRQGTVEFNTAGEWQFS